MKRKAILCAVSLFLTSICFSQYTQSAPDSIGCMGYSVKNGKVYLCDYLIEYADPASFQCVKYEYSKDKYHVYFGLKMMEDTDPATFVVLAHGFCKDKYRVYYNFYEGKVVDGADPRTFKVLDRDLCRDKRWVYTRNEQDEVVRNASIDAATFRRLEEYLYYDRRFLYGVGGNILARRDTFDIDLLKN